VAALAALGALAPQAFAHAVLIGTTPTAGARLARSPEIVRLRFSEPIQLLQPAHLDGVDAQGRSVTAGQARRSPADARVIEVPLRARLGAGTYTVRYLIESADSHVIAGSLAFGVGTGPVGRPFAGGFDAGGPSETSPWAVSARFLELVGLGGLLGLLAFRWLVWRAAWGRATGFAPGEQEDALAWGRRIFWRGFAALALTAIVAEAYLVVTKSASALGVGVARALADPSGVTRVLADSRFGGLLELRVAILAALFAVALWQLLAEYGEGGGRAPGPAGSASAAGAMIALALSALAVLSVQGHASQAPLAPLSVADDVLHLTAVSVWISGLALAGVVLWRAPRAVPVGGPALAAGVLARFSRLALVAVSAAVASGVLRAIAELADPAQLWGTAYGRSIIYKLLLLCPIALIALRNRRVVSAFGTVKRPNAPTLQMVRRAVALELALALAVVVVAAVLVAQVPGRG
jgi:copper transport protein